MEECESLDSEMTELQELQCESPEAAGQDDEDEMEELRNSLREVVQDQSVKPKLQCLMVDPSFSMVTVQSEDSGIVWETASSRCSTPWASETSSTSEAYSLEGSGAQGKITIVFDEEKIERRRKMSGGRSSRLADRFRRPSSSRSGSALGVERLEMAEVSVPNIKPEKTEPDLEEIKNKDQQLFSLISEGYEILNIRVPSKLPTVDEEESTELQDNLSYLDETPMIKSRNHRAQSQPGMEEVEELEDKEEATKQDSSKPLDKEISYIHTRNDGVSDMDYFEKFTLVDVAVPGEQAPELQEEVEQPAAKPQEEELKSEQEASTDVPSTPDDDSFVFVTDLEIAGDHLDEAFYGSGVHGAPDDVLQRREDDEEEAGVGKRTQRESQKESGSVLFGSEETILTPIFLSPGPPKIIDLILLEEPTAMSFMYSDLYEDAMGERRKSDEESSEGESVASERSFKRRLSDSEETDGYLEKFILKDETPTVEVQLESEEDKREGKVMWSQNKFEMTGCLSRVVEDAEEVEEKREEPKEEEVSSAERSGNLQPSECEETGESVVETEKGREEIQPSVVIEEQVGSLKTSPEESVQEPWPEREKVEEQAVKQELKVDQTEPSESSADKPVTVPETQQVDIKIEKPEEMNEQQKEKPAETIKEVVVETEQLSQIQTEKVVTEPKEETPAEVKEPMSIEVPQSVSEPAAQTDTIAEPQVPAEIEVVADKPEVRVEDTGKRMSEEAVIDTTMAASVQEEKRVSEEVAIDTKMAASVQEEKRVSEEASIDTKMVAAVQEEKRVSEEVAIDTKMVAAVQEEKRVSEEAAIDTKMVAAVQEEKRVSEEAAIDTKMVAAVQEEKRVSEEAVIDTKMVSQVVVLTCAEPSVETETPTEVKETEKIEVVVLAGKAIPVEVIIDSEPVVEAVVELAEKIVDEGEIQTQVQIALQEIISAETPEVKAEIPEEEKIQEAVIEKTAAIADHEQEVKTKAVPSGVMEHIIAEEVKSQLDEKLVEVLQRNQSQPVEAVTDKVTDKTEQPTEVVEAKTSVEGMQAVVPETVNVGNEFILLIPKGKAVEMNIEVGQWSDHLQKTDAVASLPPTKACEDLVSPDTSAPPQAPTQDILGDVEPEGKAKLVPKEEVLPTEVLDRWPSPPAPVSIEEAEVEEPKMEKNLEEDGGVLSTLRSFSPQEDLSRLHTEDLGPQTEMHKEAEVLETHKDAGPVMEVYKETEISEIHKDYVGPVMELHKEDVGTTSELHQEVEVPHTELHRGDAGTDTEMHKEAEVLETEIQKEDVSPVVEISKEVELFEIHKEDVGPEMEVHKEDAGPVLEQHREAEVPERELHKEDVCTETEMNKEAEASETEIHKDEGGAVVELQRKDVGPDMEHLKKDIGPAMVLHKEAEVPETEPHKLDVISEVTAEELEYEIISKQEAREMPEPEMYRVAEEPRPDSRLDRERVEKEMEKRVLDLEFIEADYDIIDAEEESQARAAAELLGMDWFCLTCGCLLGSVSGEHQGHEVTSVEKAYEDIKERLGNWIAELQGRSENIEDLVSEIELAYNSVEDQCTESEQAMQAQNEEMMAVVMDQYNSMSLSMEEEKKAKLEQLYDQIVSFQESIDSTKGTLETTAREAETDARSSEDINTRLRAALESAMSLELGPRGLLVFEDYAKGNTSNSHLAQRKGIPVPQKPTLQLQEQGSATTTSVTVYWKVNSGDIIDCFQVYCMEDPQGAVSDEYRVTVKESYCVLEELEPDKTYKVWVMAVNYTGCSLPSERVAFRTAPSVPVIDTERCTVLWDSATLRWTPANQTPTQSYTLEYCRQYELEGEGLRSISGIRGTEQSVLLQPNENYLFYIKAVNEAGASEQSEAALISTKGTRFHLLKASAHPVLELSEDQSTLHYSQDTYNNTPHADSQCPSILGELLPARGHYYWETTVTGSSAYRIGVAYGTANRNSPLGENSASWCLHCIPTPSSCRFELLNDDVQSDVFVIEVPERVGTLLDFQHNSLSFYNAKSGQLLGSLSHHFTQPCHPVLGMELPGSLEISMVLEVPEFAKHS